MSKVSTGGSITKCVFVTHTVCVCWPTFERAGTAEYRCGDMKAVCTILQNIAGNQFLTEQYDRMLMSYIPQNIIIYWSICLNFISAICWCLQPAWRLKTKCRFIVLSSVWVVYQQGENTEAWWYAVPLAFTDWTQPYPAIKIGFDDNYSTSWLLICKHTNCQSTKLDCRKSGFSLGSRHTTRPQQPVPLPTLSAPGCSRSGETNSDH